MKNNPSNGKNNQKGTNLERNVLNLKVGTVVEQPQTVRYIPVRKSDWNRLKKMLSEIKPSKSDWGSFGWACFGGSVSFLASAFSIEKAQAARPYLYMLSAFMFVLGLIGCLVQKGKNKDITKRTIDVTTEMDNIEKGDLDA